MKASRCILCGNSRQGFRCSRNNDRYQRDHATFRCLSKHPQGLHWHLRIKGHHKEKYGGGGGGVAQSVSERTGKTSVKLIESKCKEALSDYRAQSRRLKSEGKLLPFYPQDDFYLGK